MIRVLIVDDHPVLQAGLRAVLKGEPGMQPIEAVDSSDAAVHEARDMNADVIVVDYVLGGESGLHLCRRLKALDSPPRVLLYSAHPEAELAIPALLAGADGVLSKSTPPHDIVEAIRALARGRRVFPEIERQRVTASAAKFDPEDLPIFGMMLEETPTVEIALTLNMPEREIAGRVLEMIDRLQPLRRPPTNA